MFECCGVNHERIETCQRPLVKKMLVEMIWARVASLFRYKDLGFKAGLDTQS